jgi:hypothetical protein
MVCLTTLSLSLPASVGYNIQLINEKRIWQGKLILVRYSYR